MTARAVASLAELVELGLPLVAPGGVLVAWKRTPLNEELDNAEGALAALRAGPVGRAERGPRPREPPPGDRSTRRSHRRPLPARPRGASPPAPLIRSGCAPRSVGPPLRYPPSDARRRPLRHPRERGGTRRGPRPIPSVDEVWHLGDVVGYGPDPDEVVARLRELGAIGVRGNHDAAALGGREIESLQRGRAPGHGVDPCDDRGRHEAWLAAQPETLEREGVLLVHGSPRDPIWEYVTSTPVARAAMAAMETRAGLHGHTHLPDRLHRGRRTAGDDEPGVGLAAGLRWPAGPAQPRQRRPAPRRHPDVRLDAARHRRRDAPPGGARPTTSAEVQAAMTDASACRSASWRACRTACRPVIGGRRPITGRKPGDRRVRVERHHSPYFRYTGPGQLTAKAAASAPTTSMGRFNARLEARAPRPAPGERGGDRRAASQEEGPGDLQLGRHLVLRLRDRGDPPRVHPGGRRWLAFQFSIPVSIAIAVLLGIVAFSYRQVCYAYPHRRRLVLGLQGELRASGLARRRLRAADRLHADRRGVHVVRGGADRLGGTGDARLDGRRSASRPSG